MSSSTPDHGALLAALESLNHLEDLPSGRIDTDPQFVPVWEAAEALAAQGGLWEAYDAIEPLEETMSEGAQLMFKHVFARTDDRFILDPATPGLRFQRIGLHGANPSVDVSEFGIRLRTTSSGTIKPEDMAGAPSRLSFAGTLHFIVNGSPQAKENFEAELERCHRQVDRSQHLLQGNLAGTYQLGVGFMALAGRGTVTITDDRMFGVIFDSHLLAGGRGVRHAAQAYVFPGTAKLVVFEMQRGEVRDVEVLDKGVLASRLPYVNVDGRTFSVAIDTVRVFDGNELVRPKKGVLAAALRELKPAGGSTAG